jgi:hypothetical protein
MDSDNDNGSIHPYLYFWCKYMSRGERLFGLSDIMGDIELYTSYDREKFADSKYV